MWVHDIIHTRQKYGEYYHQGQLHLEWLHKNGGGLRKKTLLYFRDLLMF